MQTQIKSHRQDTDRHTQTDIHIDNSTARHTQTDRQTDIHTDRQTCTQTDTHRQTYTQSTYTKHRTKQIECTFRFCAKVCTSLTTDIFTDKRVAQEQESDIQTSRPP